MSLELEHEDESHANLNILLECMISELFDDIVDQGNMDRLDELLGDTVFVEYTRNNQHFQEEIWKKVVTNCGIPMARRMLPFMSETTLQTTWGLIQENMACEHIAFFLREIPTPTSKVL